MAPRIIRENGRTYVEGFFPSGRKELTQGGGSVLGRIASNVVPAARVGFGLMTGYGLASSGGRMGMSGRGGISLDTLRPGSGVAPVVPGAGQYGAETPNFCGLITDPRLRMACEALGSFLPGGGNDARGGPAPLVPSCPPGYKRNSSGNCQLEGMAPYIPGDIGQPDVINWNERVVGGRYGSGYAPVEIEQRRLYCPPGFKLGRDNVCYECLKKKERKWDPGTKPMLTGGDLNAIRRAQRLQKKVRRMASKLLPRPVARATKRRRK